MTCFVASVFLLKEKEIMRYFQKHYENTLNINYHINLREILTILARDILQSYCGNEAFLGYTIFDYNIRQGKCLSLI